MYPHLGLLALWHFCVTEAFRWSRSPSACFLPWHLLFAQLLTMFADPTTQNDELLKGKSNLISKPYFSVSTRLLYHLCSWLTIYCYMKLFAMSLCCFPCPSGHVQRASPHQVRWLPWISILHPVPSSRFCLESRSVPFDKLLHRQCRTSPWGDTRISISHPIVSWRSQNLMGQRNL